MKIMPMSLIAVLVTGLFLFTAVQYQTVRPVLAADTINGSVYEDSDGDGTVDRIHWTMDENVTACNYEAADWTVDTVGDINVGITGLTCTGSDPELYIDITADADETGGLIAPVISYADNVTSGSVTLTSGNMGAHASVSAMDAAAPVPLAAYYEDPSGDGQVDRFRIDFTVDDNIGCGGFEAGDWAMNSAGSIGASFAGGCSTDLAYPNSIVVSVTATASITGGASNPSISYTDQGVLGDIDDNNANPVASFGPLTVSDGASPVVLATTYQDAVADGAVDRVVFYTSNDTGIVCTGFTATSDFTVTTPGTLNLGASGSDTCGTDGATNFYIDLGVSGAVGTTGGATNPVVNYVQPGNGVEDGAGNDVPSASAQTALDEAAPYPIEIEYYSTAGVVDSLGIEYSETVTTNTAVLGDFAYVANDITNSDLTGGGYGAETGTGSSFTLGTNGDAGITSHITAPTLAYTDDASREVSDAAGNQMASFAATGLSDGADPVVLDVITQDTDANGKVDHLLVTFSEPIDDSVIDSYSAGSDYTPATLAVANVTGEAVEATEGTCPLDAAEDDEFLCIVFDEDVNTCDLDDQTGCDTGVMDQDLTWTGGSIGIVDLAGSPIHDVVSGTVTEADGAGPAIIGLEYHSSLNDDSVDYFYLVFSENAAWNGSGLGQFTINNQDLTGFDSDGTPDSMITGSTTDHFSLSVSGTTDLTGVSGGTEPTLQYTQSAVPTEQIYDINGIITPDMAVTSFVDGAVPYRINSVQYSDDSGDASVDTMAVEYTENVTYSYQDSDWTVVANDLTNFDVTACTSCTNVSTLLLAATSDPDLTGVSGGTEPTVAYAAGNSIADAEGNIAADFGVISLVDDARPCVIHGAYQDLNSNAQIETVELTFSERVNFTMDPLDWDFGVAGDFNLTGDFAGAECNSGSNIITCTDTGAGTVSADTGETGSTVAPRWDYFSTGAVTDGVNHMSSVQITLEDEAVPLLEAAIATADTNVQLQVTEALGSVTFGEAAAWTATGMTASAATLNANPFLVDITVSSLGDTAYTASDFDYTAGMSGSSMQDPAGNEVASLSGRSIGDGQAPVLLQANYYDDNWDGMVEKFTTVWSENVVMSGSTSDDWTIVGGDFNAVYSASADDAGADTNLNIATTADGIETGSVAVVSIAYDNDDGNDSVTDLVGNASGTSSVITAGDMARPQFISGRATDDTTVQFQMTEEIGSVTFGSAAAWTATGLTSTGVAVNVDSTKIDLSVSPLGDPTYTAGDFAFASASGGVVEDTSSNSISLAGGVNIHDGQAPTLAETTAVTSPTSDQTPDFGFSSNEAGAISWAGGCDSVTAAATATTQTITLDADGAGGDLAEGTYNCTMTVTDGAGNASAGLSLTAFSVDVSSPTGTTTAGTATVIDSDLVQEITVVYDEPMNPATTPTITFGASAGTFSSNSDGAWSVGDTTWTETFTMTDGNEELSALTVESSLAEDVVGNVEGAAVGDTFDVDTEEPVVTDANISVAATGTGTGGDFVTGDTVTVTWDAASEATGNTDLAGAAADLSEFGGGAAVVMTDTVACGGTASDNVYEACYTLVSGSIYATNVNPTVTATDDDGNVTGPVADSGNQTVDTRSMFSTDVQPATLVVSASGTTTATFTTSSALPADGKVNVVFGAGYDVTGAANGTCSSIDGTFATTVAGQVVTITRQGDGTSEPAGAQTCTIDTIVNPSTTGSTGTYTIETTTSADVVIDIDNAVAADTIISGIVITQCSDGIDNDGNGLIDYPNDPYCSSAADTYEGYEGGSGGGGGGGGGGATTNPTSNSTTTTAVADITTLEGDQGYSSPVQFAEEDITVDEDNGTATAQLTAENGSLTMRPNSKSTISAYFPPNTTVTGPANWNGRIDPPVTRSLTMIAKSGEAIEGSSDELMREDVFAIVKIGTSVPLQFSQEVTLEIPLDLPDGSVVQVYTSSDGNTWEAISVGTVQDGKLIIQTDHFSYFAVVPTEETREVVAQMEAEAEDGFADIIGHWAEGYINEIADLGIVTGKTESTFAPNDYITRAELTKIATRAFGLEINPNPTFTPFSDVPLTAWYAPYVVAARDAGIVEGVGNDLFAPNASITRAAALKIILEAAGFTAEEAEALFDDVPTDAWYAGYVTFAKKNDVVGGYADGSFGPANFITRAEVAKVVVNVMELPEETTTE